MSGEFFGDRGLCEVAEQVRDADNGQIIKAQGEEFQTGISGPTGNTPKMRL